MTARRQRPAFPILVAVVVAALAAAALATGCTAAGKVKPEVVAQAREALVSIDQQEAELDAAIAALPAKDPVRATYDDAKAKLAEPRRVAAAIVAAAADDGELDLAAIGAALGGVPVVGPYAGLIALAAGWLRSWMRDRRHRKALTQVVASVDRALPVKTPDLKRALSSVQDESTRALVGEIKAATK